MDMKKKADDAAIKKLIEVMSKLMGDDVKGVEVEIEKKEGEEPEAGESEKHEIAEGAEEEKSEHMIDDDMAEQIAGEHVAKEPGYYSEEDDEDEDEKEKMKRLMDEYSRIK